MTTKFEELMMDPAFRKAYAIEGVITDASQIICDLLARKKMKKADLARLLNKTPAYVTQLLSGKTNMTLKTLAEIAHVLGAKLALSATDEEGVITEINASAEEECAEEMSLDWDANETHAYRIRFPRGQPKPIYQVPGQRKSFAISKNCDFREQTEDVA
jgi:transcriptional regulator with XRE-family HTH domain